MENAWKHRDIKHITTFFNAKLQDPEKNPANSKYILHFLSTYYSNFDMPNIVQSNNQKLKQSQNESINEICRESQTVLSFKELPSQIRLLSLNMKKSTVSSKFV